MHELKLLLLLIFLLVSTVQSDSSSVSSSSGGLPPQATVEVRTDEGTKLALGIVFGSLVGGLFLGFCVYYLCHRWQQRKVKRRQQERAERRKQEKKRRRVEKENIATGTLSKEGHTPKHAEDETRIQETSQPIHSRHKSSSSAGILIVGNTGAVTNTLHLSAGSSSLQMNDLNNSAASGSGVDTDVDFIPSRQNLFNDKSSSEDGVNDLPSDSTFVSDGETIQELDDILPSPHLGDGAEAGEDGTGPDNSAQAEQAALAIKRRDEEGLIDFEIHPAVTSSQETLGFDRDHFRQVAGTTLPPGNSISTAAPEHPRTEGVISGAGSSLSMTWGGDSGGKVVAAQSRYPKLALLRDDDPPSAAAVPPSPNPGDNPHFSLAFSDDGTARPLRHNRDSFALPTFVDVGGGPPSLGRTADNSDANSTHGDLIAVGHSAMASTTTNIQEDKLKLMITNTVGDAEIVSRVREIKAGRYTKLRCIGRGANGSVFSCLLGNGVTIAIKEVSVKPEEQAHKILEEPSVGFGTENDEAEETEFNNRLRENFNKVAKEMRLLANINDPHVVQVYHCTLDTKNHKALIFMELISGGSLGAMVRTMPTRMDESIAKTYVKQLVLALASIHSKGIVHRDLKCDNVLLTVEGVVKLSDFGAAKLTRKSVERSTDSSGKSGSIAKSLVGTPFFIAPEVILDDREGKGYDSKADIWSLGVTVSELLAKGELPWPKFNRAGAAFVHIARKGTVPEFPVFLSDEAKHFLTLCCARKPSERPAAKELLRHPWLASVPNTVGNSLLSVSGSSSIAQGTGTGSIRRSLLSQNSVPGTPSAPIGSKVPPGRPPPSPKAPMIGAVTAAGITPTSPDAPFLAGMGKPPTSPNPPRGALALLPDAEDADHPPFSHGHTDTQTPAFSPDASMKKKTLVRKSTHNK